MQAFDICITLTNLSGHLNMPGMYIKLQWAGQNVEADQNEELLWIISDCSFTFFEGKQLTYKKKRRIIFVNLFEAVSATQKIVREKKHPLYPTCPDILEGNTRG